jgi:hypothetical protein
MCTEYFIQLLHNTHSSQQPHGNFSKIDYRLGHKASLSKYKKIEIIPCILSDHNGLKLEINNKSNTKKHENNWKLNNTLLNYEWVINEIKEKIKIKRKLKGFWKLKKMKTRPTRTYGT